MMTVQELRDRLKRLPPNAEVVFHRYRVAECHSIENVRFENLPELQGSLVVLQGEQQE